MNSLTLFMIATLCLLDGCAARSPEQERQHDDVHYSSALRPYLRDLKPSASRKEVEDYFRARSISFGHGGSDSYSSQTSPAFDLSYSDTIELRKERNLWPCGSSDVYIAFNFKGHQPYSRFGNIETDDTDTLQSIHILKIYDCF